MAPRSSPAFNLRLACQDQGAFLAVRIRGALDDPTELVLPGQPPTQRALLVHTGGLQRIYARGVLGWLRWIQDLEDGGNHIHFVETSPATVSHVNAVEGFCGSRGVVVSFHLPWFCPSCRGSGATTLLVEQVEDASSVDVGMCQECGAGLVVDDVLESYLAFLAAHRARDVDGAIRQAVQR